MSLMDAVRRGWQLIWSNPVLWLTIAVPQIIGNILSWTYFLPYGRNPQDLVGGALFVALAAFVLAPAIASGFMVAAASATTIGKATWRDVWRGLGVFYMRIVGGFLLLMVSMMAVTAVFVMPVVARIARTAPESLPSVSVATDVPGLVLQIFTGHPELIVLLLISLIVNMVVSVWPAAVALDDTTTLEGASRSLRFTWRHMGSIFLLLLVVTVLRSSLLAGLPGSPLGLVEPAVLGAYTLVATVAISVVQSLIQAWYYVAIFVFYDRERTDVV